MNIVFYLVLLIGVAILWCVLWFVFKPLGSLFIAWYKRIKKELENEINEEELKNE